VRKVCTWTLKQSLNKEEFSHCRPTPDETTIVGKCIPLPPVLAKLFLSVNPSDPHQMGYDFARLIFEIMRDNTHILHNLISSQAATNLVDEMITWLFYAPKYPSLRMNCTAAIPGSRAFKAAQELHRAKLSMDNPNQADRQIVMHPTGHQDNPILATIERNTAAIQELTESRRETEADRTQSASDKGFNKLPMDLQNFLLAAATLDLENPADSIAQTGLELIKMSQKNAILSLSRMLKKQGRRFVNLSTSQSNEIVSINWFVPNNPFIGIATCRIPSMSKSFSHGSIFERAQKLELLQKLEMEKQEVFETLTNKSLHRPSSSDDVIRNLELVQSILELFLGPQCAVSQRIVEFIQRFKMSA
jgi:hypothetical protein